MLRNEGHGRHSYEHKFIAKSKSWSHVAAMMATCENTTYCMKEARTHDRERFYISLFAPEATRPAIWALLAFNQEIVKTKAVVSEAMLGEIRLQWWRETLGSIANGTPREHPVAQAIHKNVQNFARVRPALDEIIDTWSDDFNGAGRVSIKNLEKHARGTSGALNEAILLLQADSATDPELEVARHIGALWGLTGTLRGLPNELSNPDSSWQTLSDNGATKRLEELVDELLGHVEAGLSDVKSCLSRPISPKAKLATGLLPLVRLDVRSARRAGDSIQDLAKYQPGNMRKLVSLAAHFLLH